MGSGFRVQRFRGSKVQGSEVPFFALRATQGRQGQGSIFRFQVSGVGCQETEDRRQRTDDKRLIELVFRITLVLDTSSNSASQIYFFDYEDEYEPEDVLNPRYTIRS